MLDLSVLVETLLHTNIAARDDWCYRCTCAILDWCLEWYSGTVGLPVRWCCEGWPRHQSHFTTSTWFADALTRTTKTTNQVRSTYLGYSKTSPRLGVVWLCIFNCVCGSGRMWGNRLDSSETGIFRFHVVDTERLPTILQGYFLWAWWFFTPRLTNSTRSI